MITYHAYAVTNIVISPVWECRRLAEWSTIKAATEQPHLPASPWKSLWTDPNPALR